MKERYESKVSVCLVLTRKKDGKTEILLQERYNTGYMDGKYDTACSGHLEKGESLSMALVREAKEEIGLDISEKDLKLVSILHPYHEDYIYVVFTTDKYKGVPKIMEPNKCSKLQWFNINELPKNIIVRIEKMITNMKNNIIYYDGTSSIEK